MPRIGRLPQKVCSLKIAEAASREALLLALRRKIRCAILRQGAFALPPLDLAQKFYNLREYLIMEQPQERDRRHDLETKFGELYGSAPQFVVRAPGRVNLIGEHTDYNDGFVFPAAIERDVMIAFTPRPDRQVRAYALNFHQSSTFTLDGVQPTSENREKWSNYLRAMAWVLHEEGLATTGMNAVVLGNVPLGAGLSSSAAMLVASGLAFATASELELDPVRSSAAGAAGRKRLHRGQSRHHGSVHFFARPERSCPPD